MTARLMPEASPGRESVVIERLVLSRRLNALLEFHDATEAAGGDAMPAKREIERCLRALGAVDQLLNTHGGG